MNNKQKPAPKDRSGKGVRGRPHTNLRALAQQHTPEAIKALAGLMNDQNHCVAMGAARILLERAHGKESGIPSRKPGKGKAADQTVKVKIARFKEGGGDAE